jgi:C4-dicarboxylate transporter DctQ subunit
MQIEAGTGGVSMSMKRKLHVGRILKIHEHLCHGLFWAGGFLLFFAALATCYDVSMRYIFNRPTSWSIDFVEYCLLYSTFLGAAWILKMDGHVRMTIFLDKLETNRRRWAEITNSIIGGLACLFLAVQGTIETWDAYSRGIIIVRPVAVPKWTILWVIPFGLFLFCTYFARNVFSLLSQKRSMDAEKK